MDTKVDDMLRSANLSGEDADRLTKAFKDPEFIKLFGDYVQDLQDPQTRAENEAYLQQLEREGQTESVYGKGAQVLLPSPFCVVKTRTSSSDQTAVYINICTSNKLSPFELVPSTDPTRPGRTLRLPNCLGKETGLRTPRDQPARVWDFVVHPAAGPPFLGQPTFQAALIEMALEQVERGAGVPLVRKWKLLSGITYKGAEGVDKPAPLMYKTPEGGDAHVVGGRFRPLASSDSALAAALAGAPPPAAAAAEGGASAGGSSDVVDDQGLGGLGEDKLPVAAGGGGGGGASARRSSCASLSSCDSGGSGGSSSWGEGMAGGFLKRKSWPSGHAPRDPKQPGYQHPDGGVTPSYQLVHRGAADLGDTWGDSGRALAAGKAAPQELVVRVSLPGVTSSATLELEVTATGVHLVLPEKFTLDLPLPHAVDSHKGTAKFDPVKQQLTLILPVLPKEVEGAAVTASPDAAAAVTVVPPRSPSAAPPKPSTAAGAAGGRARAVGGGVLQQPAGSPPAAAATAAATAAVWPETPEPQEGCGVLPAKATASTTSSSSSTFTSSSSDSMEAATAQAAPSGPPPAAAAAAAGSPALGAAAVAAAGGGGAVKTATQLAWEALHAQHATTSAKEDNTSAAAAAAAPPAAAVAAAAGGSVDVPSDKGAAAAAPPAAAAGDAVPPAGAQPQSSSAATTTATNSSSGGCGSSTAAVSAGGVRLPPRLLGARRLAADLD